MEDTELSSVLVFDLLSYSKIKADLGRRECNTQEVGGTGVCSGHWRPSGRFETTRYLSFRVRNKNGNKKRS